jgi:hypothetical protein
MPCCYSRGVAEELLVLVHRFDRAVIAGLGPRRCRNGAPREVVPGPRPQTLEVVRIRIRRPDGQLSADWPIANRLLQDEANLAGAMFGLRAGWAFRPRRHGFMKSSTTAIG